MRQIFMLLVLFVITGFDAKAQTTAKVSGTVQDDQGKSLTAATVSLLKARDSALVKIAISDKAGIYEFVNIKEGAYLLSFSSVGFKKTYSKSFDVKGNDVE